jgi:hypothetical protein
MPSYLSAIRSSGWRNLTILALGWALTTAAPAADKILFDFTAKADLTQIVTADAKVSAATSGAGLALRIVTGHQATWPGVTLRAPGGSWDLSAFAQIATDIKNTGTNPITVFCRVDNPGADGVQHCITGSLDLGPGRTGTLKVPLKRTSDDKLSGKLFGMRGYPTGPGDPAAIDPAHVTQILVFLSKPDTDHQFEVRDVRANGHYTPPTASVTDATPFLPFIDSFGQYRHKDWPGKTTSLADLAIKREQEARDLAKNPGPGGWDKYGGWAAGPSLKATGFFRTQKVGDKWWLVDPDGHLFFSQGLDCVRMLDTTPIDERQDWFEAYPGPEPQFAEFLSRGYALKGHYEGHQPQCFCFAGANLLRKYGAEWRKTSAEIIHKRLRSWGLNTIGNWSDESVRLMRRTAYTDSVGSSGAAEIQGSEGYWGKFPDVFDPRFTDAVRREMGAKKGKSAGDPWCIGYFSDNEMSWGDEVSLAIAALQSSPRQAAKQAFVADLKAKYSTIARLNEAWGATHASWEALLESRQAPDKEKARADLTVFYTKVAERYFQTVREAIKSVAPNQLYLGCRFAAVNSRAAAAAAKYCDVVSYNLYQRSVADFQFNGGADVPLLIGEFHFGALDRGLFHTGLVPVADQAARAQAYKDYVQGAVRHPQFVGCHWFQYQDEPTIGRVYDEENYQIGFVDVADTPYAETVEAAREVGRELYR